MRGGATCRPKTVKFWIRGAGAAAAIGFIALAVAGLAPTTGHADVDVVATPLQSSERPALVVNHAEARHMSVNTRFLSILAKNGAGMFDASSGKELAVQNAKTVCANIKLGASWQDEAQAVVQAVAGYSQAKADFFTELAIQTYCPQAWHS